MMFILRHTAMTVFAVYSLVFVPSVASAALPQPGDLLLGLSNSNPTLTLELVRGDAVELGGMPVASPYQDTPFIQSVRFDNTGGINHNANGNVIGVNFGAAATGGQLYSFGTNTTDPAPAGQLIADFTGLGGTLPQPPGLDPQSRLYGVSISPNNDKIAVMAYDWGEYIVWDYTPGDTMGSGAALANARVTSSGDGFPTLLYTADSQGTTWVDNETVVSLTTDGKLLEIDSATMNVTEVATVTPPTDASVVTSIYFNDQVSPYLYGIHSGFTGGTAGVTFNTLFVFDPSNNYSLLRQADFSTSSNTFRDLALDADGNLFVSTFSGVVEFIPDVVSDPSSIADNSSVDWYDPATFAPFSGLDIGFGEAAMNSPGDFNSNGVVDLADYTLWRDNLGAADETAIGGNGDGGGITAEDYGIWKANFGTVYASSGQLATAAVPEPGSTLLAGIAVLVGAGLFGRKVQ